MKIEKKIVRGIKKEIKKALGLSKKPIKRQYFSKEVKHEVLKFQRYKCAVNRCGFHRSSWRYLEFDHIRNRSDNSVSNCQALCPFHHRQKTKRDRIKNQIEGRLNSKKTRPKRN